MHAERVRTAWLRIILVSAHVNLELLVIRYLDAFQSSTAAVITNVQPEQFAMAVFAVLFAHQAVTASAINYACKACVNPLAMATPAVLNSNSAQITFARKKCAVTVTTIVIYTKTASLTATVVLTAKTHATVAYCAVVMQNAMHGTTTPNAPAKQDSQAMLSLDVDASNVKLMLIALQTNFATDTFARLLASQENLAAKTLSAPQTTTSQSAIVNQDSAVIHISVAMLLISVVTHLAVQELAARTTRAPSIALAVAVMLVIRTTKAVAQRSNVEQTTIVHLPQNASKAILDRNVVMSASKFNADRIPTVLQSTTWHTVIAVQALAVMLLTFISDVDHCQLHANCRPIAQPTPIAMVAIASQLAVSTRNVRWRKSAMIASVSIRAFSHKLAV